MFRIRALAVLGLAATTLVACGEDDPTGGEPVCTVTNVAITQAPQSITVGALGTLQAQVTQTDCDPIPTVTWTSSNINLATVTPSGAVTAIAAGTVTITAAAGGKSANVQVQIVADSGPIN